MGLALKKEPYTYQDYLSFPDDERWEIIDGYIHNMNAAPRISHQNIVGNFYTKLKTHPNNKCYTGLSPTDVVFDDFNVVQPDVFIICKKDCITEKNIKGVPELIIEVASPSTEIKDKREKKYLYQRFGVKEYIIAFPDGQYIEKYNLTDGKYTESQIFNWDESFLIEIMNIEINLWEIFDKEKP